MNNIQNLYKVLFENELLNLSFEDFVRNYENEDYKRKVFQVASEEGLFTQDYVNFEKSYSLPKVQPAGVDAMGNDIMIGGKESQEQNTWLEDAFGKNSVTDFFGDIYRSGKQGWAAGQSVDEALELYKKGEDLSDEDLQAFLDANKRMQEAGVSDEMLEYQRIYEEEGGGTWAAIKAFAQNPTIMPQVVVSSISQMLSSAEDSEEVLGTAAASAGVGAAAGAAIGSTGFSLGPLGVLTTGGGAVSGAVGGFFGGLTGVMETGNTLAQLLQEDIGEGVEMTKENVRAILEDPEKFESLKNRALARGLTIGAIEGITAGLSRGVGASMVSGAGKKALTATAKKQLATGVALGEMTAGAGGEYLGQKAAGQETDASEIFLEGIAEAKGVTNIADILAKKSYTLNGGKASRKEIESFLNDPSVSNADKAKAKIEIEGDKSLQEFVSKVQGDALIESQIDEKITDQKDRDKLVELEAKRAKAELDSKKEGVYAVPNAKQNLENVQSQINELLGKYEGAVGFGESDVAVDVQQERIKGSIEFAEREGAKIGKKVNVLDNDAAAQAKYDQLLKEGKVKESKNVKGTDGFIIGDQIYINKEVAGKMGAISVGSHELLHGIIGNSFGKLDTDARAKLGKSFMNTLTRQQRRAVERRLKVYGIEGDAIFQSEEMFTAFSDAIEKNEITFNEGVFSKIGNAIEEVLRKLSEKGLISEDSFLYRKEFSNGRQVYNFLKEYNKNVKAGKLGERATAFAAVDQETTEMKESRSKAVAAVNEIEQKLIEKLQGQGKKYTKAEFQNSDEFNDLYGSIALEGGAINNYIKSLGMSPQKTAKTIKEATDRLLGYNPQAERKSGKKDAITIGERIMSDIRYAKLDAAKQLAVESAEEARKKRIDDDTRTESGDRSFDIAEEETTSSFEEQDLTIRARQEQTVEDTGQVGKPKQSKFRRALGFETGEQMYNDILEAARKSVLLAYRKTRNITNPAERAIAIRELIRQEYFTKGLTSDIFKPIKNFLGAKPYIKNLREHREAIVNAISTADFVQMERKIPESERIFTRFVKKLTAKDEVQDAVNRDLLPPDALDKIDKGQAVNLYEKIMPTEAEFIAYADQPAVNPLTGARSGLKGTRKDGFAKAMANTLVLDATMEVRQSEAVVEALEDDVAAQLDEATLAAKIGRDVDVKFSKSINNSATPEFLQKQNADRVKFSKTNRAKIVRNIDERIAAIEDGDRYESVRDYMIELRNQIESGASYDNIVAAMSRFNSEFEGSFMLEKALNSGSFNSSHVLALLEAVERLTDAQIRKIAFPSTLDYLRKQLEKSNNKAQALADWLKVFSRSIRTSKVQFINEQGEVVTITTNAGLFQHVLRPIISEFNIEGFSLRKNEKGTRSYITFEGQDLQPFMPVSNIKKNPLNSESQMNQEADQAIEYIDQLLRDETIPDSVKKAIVKLLSVDQMGAGRKTSKLGIVVTNIEGKSILDHRPTMNEIRQKAFKAIDSKKYDDFKKSMQDGRVNLIPKQLDDFIKKLGMQSVGDPMNDSRVRAEIAKQGYSIETRNGVKFSKSVDIANEAILFSRSTKNPSRGMSAFDFDETLIIDGENFIVATKDGKEIKISSGQWPIQGPALAEAGWKFDFSDFVNVRGGVDGPLLQKMRNQIKKYGPNNVYILTARPQESATAIHGWLKSKDITIPLENITGLGNSTGEAKALWMLQKFSEGYNDMYFVDDALPNVEAVKNALDQLDIKSDVQQARVKFSKTLNSQFNQMIEENKGVDRQKIFSRASAKKLGRRPGGFRFFVPPSADDFLGLLRYFIGKGRKGEADMAFFKKALIDPYARAYREMNSAKMAILRDFRELLKRFDGIKKKLRQRIPDSEYTYDNAVRVYLFNLAGFDIPGLSDAEVATLVNIVTNDPQLMAFAGTLSNISRQKEGYFKPGENWLGENIAMDMQNGADRIGREKYLVEWQENVDEIFSADNLNKIEAVYGTDVREALEDMLYAMKTGQNRPSGSNRIANKFMNWINNSVGAIMFFNMRSGVLQLLSIVNFLNFEGNNIFSAAAMFANQKQYWSDFVFLFNSDYLSARREGVKLNINEAELANAVAGSTNKAVAAIRYILSLGFTPTQIADSFAIATGGATYYRSRIKKYLEEGMSEAKAKEQAFLDFQEIAEETQQSARPDKISQQQRSVIGRIILNFANTPMQMARLTKKAAQDLLAGRGDWRSNVSRILYYGAVQNIIFASLQQAFFALLGMDEDEEKEEKKDEKIERIFNGALDSLLRGSGIYGAVASTIKNTIMRFYDEREKGYKGDYGNVIVEALNLSPSIGSKFRKMYSALKTDKYNKHVYDRMGYDTLENPVYNAITLGVESTTNIPINRMLRKIDNIKAAFDDKNTALQRIFVALGWDQWSLGIDSYAEVDKVKEEIKKEKKEQRKQENKIKKDQEVKDKTKQYEEDQKKEIKEGKKDVTCSHATSSGKRCKRKPVKNGKCTVHEEVELIGDEYKDRQCRRIKSDGSRCKMMTRSKSQFCFYHD